MRTITVFYAWQSDTPERFNRHLIRMSLEIAARRISLDPAIAATVAIDADTQGVPGQPPVTQTILGKIDRCNIFCPDFTFVAKTKKRKLIPNPNVLTEYGYALRAKSNTAMMPVMNTSFGPPEKLPFDMGHLRYPISFEIKESASNLERRAVRAALATKVELALRTMISSQLTVSAEEKVFPRAKEKRPGFFFDQSEVLASFGAPGEQEYKLEGQSCLFLRIYPQYADQPRVGNSCLEEVFQRRNISAFSNTIGALVCRNSYGWALIDPASGYGLNLTQGFSTGEIWGINSDLFRPMIGEDPLGRFKDSSGCFSIVALEKMLMRVLKSYIDACIDDFKLRTPFIIELGAVGLRNKYIIVPNEQFNWNYAGPIHQGEIVRKYIISDMTLKNQFSILREFFLELYDIVSISRERLLTQKLIEQHHLIT